MAHKFAELAFTPAVQKVQAEQGSRHVYARMEDGEFDYNNLLGPDEAAFIEARDSVYMATTSETGWPYIQHRGGPAGFIKVLNERQIGFLDYRGNRQYVSVGNLSGSDKVSMFFMDYPRKARLKLLGHARVVTTDEAKELGLIVPDSYRAHPERAMVIDVAGYDWNCPQHITERYTLDEVRPAIEKLQARIQELEDQIASTKS